MSLEDTLMTKDPQTGELFVDYAIRTGISLETIWSAQQKVDGMAAYREPADPKPATERTTQPA